MAIVFETNTLLDLRAIMTLGINAKPNTKSPIGFFGTGLKYAIAVLVREKIPVKLMIGLDIYEFYSKSIDFRGKDFDIIRMKHTNTRNPLKKFVYKDLPFTTELGKNWKLWQAYRELHSNTLDEDGLIYEAVEEMQEPNIGKTKIIVGSMAFAEEYHSRSNTFLEGGLRESKDAPIQYMLAPCKHIYYRGMRVHDLDKPSRVTWNILSQMELTEDRTLKWLYYAESAIRDYVVGSTDVDLITAVAKSPEGTFEHRFDFNYASKVPSPAFASVVRPIMRSDPTDDMFNATLKPYMRTYDPVLIEETKKVQPLPEEGSVWQHHNGNLYEVMCIANKHTERPDKYPITVVYRGPQGRVWSRPFDRWYSSMTHKPNLAMCEPTIRDLNPDQYELALHPQPENPDEVYF